jgi:alanine-alpha-ketoisovalerate/valine-pyruvate aminotransferase
MGAFEDLHHKRITGSLAMFDRMIFKGHLSMFFPEGAVRAFLWAQGVPITEFTDYAKRTTEQIANTPVDWPPTPVAPSSRSTT